MGLAGALGPYEEAVECCYFMVVEQLLEVKKWPDEVLVRKYIYDILEKIFI